jgi:hypothetical protein
MSDSDNKPVESMLFNSLKLVFGSAVRGVWLGEVTGLENVPQTGSAIIASNATPASVYGWGSFLQQLFSSKIL